MKSKLGLVAAFTVALSLAMPAVAHESGKWVLRAGAGVVSPKSNNFGLGDVDLGDGSTAVNSRIEVDDGTSLVLGATYMMNANWAIDILAAAPFEHDIDLAGSVNGSSISAKIGSTKHLPPTVSLQYHFAPEAVFQPYVGLGVNYTLFSSESVTSTAEAAGIAAIRLDDSFGAAAQLGDLLCRLELPELGCLRSRVACP